MYALQATLDQLSDALRNEGLSFDESILRRVLLALQAKPFLILAGMSGTGKSALPRAIMAFAGQDSVKPIAVSPDWTDQTDMLGYFDRDGKFIPGEFTTLLNEARANPNKPYFAILDEMNLARVEYYLAAYLSSLESAKFDEILGWTTYSDFIFNSATRKRLANDTTFASYADLRLCANFFVIGTVNVDETTFSLSRKVLDRVNVIEFPEVDLRRDFGTLGISNPELAGIEPAATTGDAPPEG